MPRLISTLKVNKERALAFSKQDYSNATDLADYLSMRGVPFRTSHEIVGNIVKYAESKNISLDDIPLDIFKKFSNKKLMYNKFPKISYKESMLKYGSDKPDLRNPLIISDITEIFTREDVSFEIFKKLVKAGSKVRCISTKDTKGKPRSFFDNIDKCAKEQGASGLAYFTFEKKIMNFQQKDQLESFFLKKLWRKL